MTDFSLNAICINYSDILNNAILDFFNDFNSSFIHENNKYVFSDNISKQRLKKYFKEVITSEIHKHIENTNSFEKIYLITSCKVNNNIVFSSKDKSDYNITYKLLEDDIYIDIIKFEDIFDEIFRNIKIKNVVLLRHFNFSYSQLYNVILKYYGINHCRELNISRKNILYDLNNDINIDKQYIKIIKDKINFNIQEILEFIKKT